MTTDTRAGSTDDFVERFTAHLDGLTARPGDVPTEGTPATEPAEATQPATEQPEATQPAPEQPEATQPAGTEPAEATQPAGTEPAEATQPAGTEPAEFAALAQVLRSPATWTGPPPDLRETLLSRVQALATQASATDADAAPETTANPEMAPAATATPAGAPESAAVPSAPAARRRGLRWPTDWRPSWGRLAWAVPAVAVAAALFTVAVLGVDRALQPDPPPAERYVATGTQFAPRATADVAVRDAPAGFSIVIDADGLPAAAAGSYYAAWLRGPQGTVPLGSFHQRRIGDPVTLWSGVDPADYPNFMITLQGEGDPPTPSDLVVMTGTLGG